MLKHHFFKTGHAYAYKMHAQKTHKLRINLFNMVQHHRAALLASQGSAVVLGEII
jgi:hypothetical protein